MDNDYCFFKYSIALYPQFPQCNVPFHNGLWELQDLTVTGSFHNG